MMGVSMSATECNPVNFLVSKSLQWKPSHLFWLKPKLFGVFSAVFDFCVSDYCLCFYNEKTWKPII